MSFLSQKYKNVLSCLLHRNQVARSLDGLGGLDGLDGLGGLDGLDGLGRLFSFNVHREELVIIAQLESSRSQVAHCLQTF